MKDAQRNDRAGRARAPKAEAERFKIYAITRRDGREMVRWTDTKLKKDHHESLDRLLERFELGFDGLTEQDAEAFLEARKRFLAVRKNASSSTRPQEQRGRPSSVPGEDPAPLVRPAYSPLLVPFCTPFDAVSMLYPYLLLFSLPVLVKI